MSALICNHEYENCSWKNGSVECVSCPNIRYADNWTPATNQQIEQFHETNEQKLKKSIEAGFVEIKRRKTPLCIHEYEKGYWINGYFECAICDESLNNLKTDETKLEEPSTPTKNKSYATIIMTTPPHKPALKSPPPIERKNKKTYIEEYDVEDDWGNTECTYCNNDYYDYDYDNDDFVDYDYEYYTQD